MPTSSSWPRSFRPLTRDVRALLIVDVVDSVVLISHDEENVVSRWLLVDEAINKHILPRFGGRMVKSLGDGMLMDFKQVSTAAAAAFAIQALCAEQNAGLPSDRHLHVRMAIEVGDIIIGEHDIYGHSVNLAARMMSTLAGPCEIVISANARDQLTPSLDAEITDLGDCYLKSIKEPVRAYRIGPPNRVRSTPSLVSGGRMLPGVAIIPFASRMAPPEHDILGEVLADELIRGLSRSQNIAVISRLSTSPFRDRLVPIATIGAHLKVDYVVSGTYRTVSNAVHLDLELSEVRSERIAWSDHFADKIDGILQGQSDLIQAVVGKIYNSIATQELRRTRLSPLATLETYTLLLSAIILMHRRSARDFLSAREYLEAVIEREPHQSLPKAWLANWHVLRIQQGLSEDTQRDTDEAVRCTRSALDLDPESSLALAIDGLVHTHMTKRHDLAATSYERATHINPNDSLAWLLKGTHYAFTGDGPQAVHDTQKALRLSPIDPQSYYYHSLCASAYLAAAQNELAVTHADISLQSNRLHTSTLRAKSMALWRLGLHQEAKATCAELLRLEPNLTVSGWLERSPTAPYEFGRGLAKTLLELGVPN